MKTFFLWAICLISLSSVGQIQFTDCETNEPISNLMIMDANNNYIGITNEKGWLEKEIDAQQLVTNHPAYGNQTISISNEKQVCISSSDEELEELVIEKGVHVREQLLTILENSYKAFSKENQRTVYKITDYAYVNNVLNESLLGYLKINKNGKGIRYLNPEYVFTEYIFKKEYNYYILPHYTPFALDEQIFPLHNKKDYREFVATINESEISKSGDYFYIDLPKIDDFITIQTHPENKKIARISFPKVQKDGRRKFGSFVQYVNTEMFFDTQNTYRLTRLELKNYYQFDGKNVNYDMKAVEVNLPKKEVSAMKSYRLLGIPMVNSMINFYIESRREYNKKHGVTGERVWYYE